MGEIEAGRPKTVDAALAIMAVQLVVGCMRSLNADLPDAPGVSPAAFVSSVLIATVLSAFFVARIAGGRNWARVIFTTMTAYGMLKAVAIGVPIQETPTNTAIRMAMTIASVVAIVLLFTPTSNAWFRQARLVRAAGQ